MKAYVGCSGYYYPSWKGKFYPEDIPQSKWLEYYCTHFNTIEINASFYRFPTLKGLKTWYSKTPDDFVFTIKAHKIITHNKRFKNLELSLKQFYEVAQEGLGDKLKCVLFQLPGSIKYTEETLTNITDSLDPKFTNVLEFRDESWWNEEVYKTLKKHKITFASSSFPKLPEDLVKTANTGYIRFHGVPVLYRSSYNENELKAWAQQAKEQKFKELFIYFNNTAATAAITNAKKIEHLLKIA